MPSSICLNACFLPTETFSKVPENSPQPVIAPPKRRRLRLNPSPLPVKISRNKAMNKLSEAPATDTPESAESIGNGMYCFFSYGFSIIAKIPLHCNFFLTSLQMCTKNQMVCSWHP